MSFAESLKQIRKQNNLSQEDLAELLDVSRQAVSKREQGTGYPEVDKLLMLAICITSPHENVIINCVKVVSSQKFKGGKDSPQYALFGVGIDAHPFWGQPNTFLGWYADKDSLDNEIKEIQNNLTKGIASYELKYSVRTERSWFKNKIVRE